MIILALDTCLAASSVVVLDGDRVLAAATEPMLRGHQERLATLALEVMATAGVDFATLQRIAVTVGPGSFTGLRVGVAFAKGLAGALGIPLVGVGTLEALAASVPAGEVAAVIDPKRDQLYLQLFRDGAPLTAPEVLPRADAIERIALMLAADATIIGPGAPSLAEALPGARILAREVPDPAEVARIGARSDAPAAPLYLRAPDARLPA